MYVIERERLEFQIWPGGSKTIPGVIMKCTPQNSRLTQESVPPPGGGYALQQVTCMQACDVWLWCNIWCVWYICCTVSNTHYAYLCFGGKPKKTPKNKMFQNKGTIPSFQIPSLQPSCSHPLPIPTFYPKCHLNRFRLTRQLDDFGGWNGLFGSVVPPDPLTSRGRWGGWISFIFFELAIFGEGIPLFDWLSAFIHHHRIGCASINSLEQITLL